MDFLVFQQFAGAARPDRLALLQDEVAVGEFAQRFDVLADDDDLTFDQLLPRSRAGPITWINVVAVCSPCDIRKANLTPQDAGMYPAQMPFQPTVQHLHRNGRLFRPNYLHESWLDYLYWDSELEP